jgi:hypothetical protein
MTEAAIDYDTKAVESTAAQQHSNETALQRRSETAAVMQTIERIAMNPDADPAKLEKMLDMQERILDRNARMEYDAAMADLQAEMPEVERLADGHNSKYAKFEHILAAIKPHLKKHGFSITHRERIEDHAIYVTGILSHRGGHREETTLPLPPDDSGKKNPVQAIGSSIEYGRRYTTNSLLGIATKDADVDGGQPEDPQKRGPETITREQVKHLMALIREAKTDPETVCKKVRVDVLHNIQVDRYQAVVNLLNNRIKEVAGGQQ